MKHTKGEWRIYEIEGSEGYGIDADEGNKSIVSGTSIESRADARLIVAAPDMLEALEAVMNSRIDYTQHSDLVIMVDTAINKAKGGE